MSVNVTTYNHPTVCEELILKTPAQSSTFEDLGADKALDGDPKTMCHSKLEEDPFWTVSRYFPFHSAKESNKRFCQTYTTLFRPTSPVRVLVTC